ncbi:MAG: type 4a pilus biogenesis protein PilO [Porticoccaceae bacterium]
MPLPESLNQLRAINFSDLAIKQIGVWPLLLRISLWLLIFVAILLCGEVFVISDLRRQFHIAAENESKLLRLYSAKAFQTANLDAYRQQLIDLKSMFTASVKQLPDTADMPNLLEDINNTAISSGLRMQAISLQPEKVAEFTFELPMRIEVTGDYHAFGSFVSGITSLTRVVTLHDYSIETYNESSLKMVIEAKAYRYRESAN